MIERAESAKYAKSKFFEDFNDVDIYVEDTAKEARKVYVELLSRAFGYKLNIVQVFPVGPKSAVIKRCKNDQGVRARPAVYIVDGDYDILTGAPAPNLKRLYRLKRYCIENYLLDPDAVVDVLCDESIDSDEKAIKTALDYQSWAACISRPICELVVALAAASLKQCGLPTVKIDLKEIQGQHWDHIDNQKVMALIDRYKAHIDAQYGEGASDALLPKMMETLGGDFNLSFLKFSSAKALLLPLLISRIKRRLQLEIEYPKLRVKLARRCDTSEISDIAQHFQ